MGEILGSQLLDERVALKVTGRVAGILAPHVELPSDQAMGEWLGK
jgi:hypothetical protein